MELILQYPLIGVAAIILLGVIVQVLPSYRFRKAR
jgi:hypothetical protein